MTEVIVIGVFALRLTAPLLILRYPLPGILAAIAADMLDGAIISGLTGEPLAGYQNFDKALDTYYLAIAYYAMVRNWSDPIAIRIGRALFFYRLAGVAVFSLSDERIWLFAFAATFELFFIYYEVARLRWRPERLSARHMLTVVACAWVLVKLPQEYWIHVAQGSTTDWMKETVFGVDPSTSRVDAISARPGMAAALVAAGALVLLLARFAVRFLPAPDHRTVFNADAHPALAASAGGVAEPAPRTESAGWLLVEKIAIISMVGLIFAEFLPGIRATPAQMVIAATVSVVVGTVLGAWLARRERREPAAPVEFAAMCLLSLPAVSLVSRGTGASIEPSTTLFYVLLFTLLITVHDRAHETAAARLAVAGPPEPARGAS